MSDQPTVLDQLAAAKTRGELLTAHRAVRRELAQKRRSDGTEWGVLAQTYTEAMRIWAAQKADGVSLLERERGLERTLRAAWPKGRTEPWHYLCDRCDDTGWLFGACTPETPCGRPFTLPNQRPDDYTGRGRCTPNHRYATPCWCEKGQMFRRGLEGQKAKPEDFKQAGKSRDFKRVGR